MFGWPGRCCHVRSRGMFLGFVGVPRRPRWRAVPLAVAGRGWPRPCLGYVVGARLSLHGVCRPISYVVNGGEKFLYRELSREDLILGDIVSLKWP